MHFVADENMPLASIQYLRLVGHTVHAIAEDAAGITDHQVLAFAIAEQAILLTFDRDYGELIYRYHLAAPPGIIYFRGRPHTPTAPAEQLVQMLTQEVPLVGYFTIIAGDIVRRRPLP